MTDHPILFLDSGIGGIPYCRHFHLRNPGESIVYLADRLHFPYGNRDKDELIGILSELIKKIVKSIDPKIAVLVCNTATIAALSSLRDLFPALPFVGTIPAIKPAALASRTGKIGVLGTELTINAPNIRELAAKFGGGEVIGIAAPELVEFVEERFNSASAGEKREIVTGYLNRFRGAGVDTLVLGCTHFLFLQEDFQREASPDIAVFDSVTGISRRIESLLAENFVPQKTPGLKNRMLLTGQAAPEPSWKIWADYLGQHQGCFILSLLDEK